MAFYEKLPVGKLIAGGTAYLNGGAEASTLTVDGASILTGGMKSTSGSGAVKVFKSTQTLADTGEFALPDATEGFALATDGTEYIIAHVSTDGSVLGVVTSTNSVAADTDGNLCIYDGGTAANVKNHLGSEATISVLYFYFA